MCLATIDDVYYIFGLKIRWEGFVELVHNFHTALVTWRCTVCVCYHKCCQTMEVARTFMWSFVGVLHGVICCFFIISTSTLLAAWTSCSDVGVHSSCSRMDYFDTGHVGLFISFVQEHKEIVLVYCFGIWNDHIAATPRISRTENTIKNLSFIYLVVELNAFNDCWMLQV